MNLVALVPILLGLAMLAYGVWLFRREQVKRPPKRVGAHRRPPRQQPLIDDHVKPPDNGGTVFNDWK